MAHDHNGRVGPPRCEECNAPLNSDERRSVSTFARSLCLDCHRERNPFPRIEKKRRRPGMGRELPSLAAQCRNSTSPLSSS